MGAALITNVIQQIDVIDDRCILIDVSHRPARNHAAARTWLSVFDNFDAGDFGGCVRPVFAVEHPIKFISAETHKTNDEQARYGGRTAGTSVHS